MVHMPLMDVQPQTSHALSIVLKDMNRLELSGSLLNQNTDQYPSIERRSFAIRWMEKSAPACHYFTFTGVFLMSANEPPRNILSVIFTLTTCSRSGTNAAIEN